jgi:hypothetical protein
MKLKNYQIIFTNLDDLMDYITSKVDEGKFRNIVLLLNGPLNDDFDFVTHNATYNSRRKRVVWSNGATMHIMLCGDPFLLQTAILNMRGRNHDCLVEIYPDELPATLQETALLSLRIDPAQRIALVK